MLSTLLCIAPFIVAPVQAHAKNYRIVIIETSSLPIITDIKEAFLNELALLLPTDEFDIEVYNANGIEQKANELVHLAVKDNSPDLLVSVATLATRAVYSSPEAANVQKLFMGVADPIAEGIVTHFGEHSSGNITGESHVIDAKVKVDMLDALLTDVDVNRPLNIALVHSDYPSSTSSVEQLLAIEHHDENINFVRVSTPYIEGSLGLTAMKHNIVATLKENVTQLDGYWLSTGPLLQADKLIETIYTETQLLPVFAENVNSVKNGALLGIVSDVISVGKSGALRAKRILQGNNANEIPVTRVEKYTIAVNVSTAITMQIPVPSSYLKLAKSNVYH